MFTNRPRAKSHSNAKYASLSSSSPSISTISTVQEEGRPNSEGASSPQIIKVIRSKTPIVKPKAKVGWEESAEDVDIIEPMLQEDQEGSRDSKDTEEGILSSSPVKFNLFSPRRKSKLQASPRNSSPRPSSKSSSPRSNASNSSPRGNSPRTLKSSPNSSPRLTDSADFIPLGESPVEKKEATFVYEAAKQRISNQENESYKKRGLLYKHIGKNQQGNTKEYDVLLTGAGESGLGSLVFFIDRTAKKGEGGSAKVYVAYDAQTGEKYIAKIFKESAVFKMIEAEINALTALGLFYGGYNLLKLSQGERIIITKHYPGDTLLKTLYEVQLKENDEVDYPSKHSYVLPLKFKMIMGVMNAVANLHDHKYIHRDIKPANFLCQMVAFDSVEVNLIDFDSAIPETVKTARVASSFGYMAPEHATGEPVVYSYASDFFSTGVVIWEIISPDDVNYQQLLNLKCAKIVEEEKWHRHLKREEFLELMPDFVKSFSEAEADPRNIGEYIYKTKIEAHLYSLVAILLQEKPEARLKGTTLRDEISKVEHLADLYEGLTNAMTLFLSSVNTLQLLSIPLELLKPLTQKISSLEEKDLLMIATAALNQSQTADSGPEGCIEESMRRITDSFKALKTYLSAYSLLQKYQADINPLFIKPIIKAHTKDSEEVFTLLEELSVLAPARSYRSPHI